MISQSLSLGAIQPYVKFATGQAFLNPKLASQRIVRQEPLQAVKLVS